MKKLNLFSLVGLMLVTGFTTYAQNVGINTTTPNGELTISPTAVKNRKIVLWDGGINNDHQYYGLGINGATFRYQIDGTGSSHVWYAATSTTTSAEIMRLTGTGLLGLGLAVGNLPNVTLTLGASGGANKYWQSFRDNDAGNTQRWYTRSDANNSFLFQDQGSNNRFTIMQSGNVGVGTLTPAQRFTVMGGPLAQGDWVDGDKFLLLGGSEATKIAHLNLWGMGFYAGSNSNVMPNGQVLSGGDQGYYRWYGTNAGNNGWTERMGLDANGTLRLPTGNIVVGSNGVSGTAGSIRYAGNKFFFHDGTGEKEVALVGTGSAGWGLTGNAGTAAGTNFIGTTDAVDLVFRTQNIERMRLANSGRLGIGTNNPVGAIHMMNNNVSDNNDDFILETSATGNIPGMFVRRSLTGGANLTNGTQIGQFTFEAMRAGGYTYATSAGFQSFYKGDGTNNLADFRIMTNNTDRMTINENGKVGIGTITPNADLQVHSGNTFTSINVSGGNGVLGLQTNGNGWGLPTLNTINAGTRIIFNGGTATSATTTHVAMGVTTSGGATSDIMWYSVPSATNNHQFRWYTGDQLGMVLYGHGYTQLAYENGNRTVEFSRSRMHLYESTERANPAIQFGAANNSAITHIMGTNRLLVVNGSNGVELTASATAWSAASDIRLKENITPIENALSKVMKLRGVSYNFKTDKNRREIGVIAQEVQAQFPLLVEERKTDGILSVTYDRLAPILIEAVKELKAEIDALKAENAGLKSQNSDLKSKSASLESRLEKIEEALKLNAKAQKD